MPDLLVEDVIEPVPPAEMWWVMASLRLSPAQAPVSTADAEAHFDLCST